MSRRGIWSVGSVLLVLLVVSVGTWVAAGRADASARQRLAQQTAYTEARAAVLRGDCTAALGLLAKVTGPDDATALQVKGDESTCQRYRSTSAQIRAGRPPDAVVPALLGLVRDLPPMPADKARAAARKQLLRPGALDVATCRRTAALIAADVLPTGSRDPLTHQVLGTCWSVLRTVDPKAAEAARRTLLAEVTRGPVPPTDPPPLHAGGGTATRFRITNQSPTAQLVTFVGAGNVVQFRLPACRTGCEAVCSPTASLASRRAVSLPRGRYTVLMQDVAVAGPPRPERVPLRGVWSMAPGRIGVCLTR